jgi:hypothetical protein
MEVPVKYAKSGDVHLAYRIFGEGPRDIVLVPGTLSHAELSWERAAAKHLLERLTAFARVIVFENAARDSPTGTSPPSKPSRSALSISEQ